MDKVQGKLRILIAVVAVLMVLYHLVRTQVALQSTVPDLNTHLTFGLFLIFLFGASESRHKRGLILYLVFAILTLFAGAYIHFLWLELVKRIFFNTTLDLIVGISLIILCFEATRRELGFALPLVVVIAMLYGFLGHLIPGTLHCIQFTFSQFVSMLSVSLQTGIFRYVSVSANYVFLFVLFGSMLQALGASTFFMRLSRLVVGRLQGGAALMAVMGSAGIGSIIGSSAANVTITGTTTIPLMKKLGYKAEEAAGIEAAASNGGQILPPVMGSIAFVMADLTGIPYVKIIAMAALPGIIYFFCVGIYVYLKAKKSDIGRLEEEKTDIRELLISAPLFIIPFIVIIALLTSGFSVMYTGFWTLISVFLVAMLRKKTRPSMSVLISGFVKGCRTGAGIAATVAVAGIIACIFIKTGLGIKMTIGIEAWSGGHLLPALLIIWAVCVILGMIGVSLTAYIVVTVFAVPALVEMGVPLGIAHFFVLYTAIFGYLTPPVAILTIIAAKLAGADYIRSAIESTKAAIAGFVLPFIFVYCPLLLLKPQQPFWEATALLGSIVSLIALQVSFVGYYIRKCTLMERVLAGTSGVLLLAFLPLQSYVLLISGIALIVFLTIMQLSSTTRGGEQLAR